MNRERVTIFIIIPASDGIISPTVNFEQPRISYSRYNLPELSGYVYTSIDKCRHYKT